MNENELQAIFALKMNKTVIDSNWIVVEEITRLAHPYKVGRAEMLEEGNDSHHIRSIRCPDCQTEIVALPTKSEMAALRKEARERILKCQEMSFQRQFETGILTTKEYDYLGGLVEAEMVAEEPRLKADNLKLHPTVTKFFIHVRTILIKFYLLTDNTCQYVPSNTLRYWCYQLATSKIVRCLATMLVCVDSALTLSQVIIYFWTKWNDQSYSYAMTAQYVHMALYFLFTLETIVAILGQGFDQYFSQSADQIEFGSGVVLGTLEIGVFFAEANRTQKRFHPFDSMLIMLIKTTLLLKLTKLHTLVVAILPKVTSHVDNVISDDMIRNYELGKAYLVALNRTTLLLNRIVYCEAVYNELMKDIDTDRMHVTRELGLMQKENPSIATTIKTRHAIRHIINAMVDCIEELKDEGVVDAIEAEAIYGSLAKNMHVLKELKLISATPPEEILKDIPWIKDDVENLKYFLQNSVLASYDYGDILLQAGDDPVGIYLLVSGLLRSRYTPSSTTLQLNAKFGVLPNYDYFNNVKFEQAQESYVVSGSIIGEIGAVSGRRYDMTITCETAVQVYYIPWDVTKKVIHEDEGSLVVMSRIWKTISINIALNILQYNVVAYQGWPPEKLLMFLNKGFVPVIPDVVGMILSSKIEAIVLIEGVLMDKFTRKQYQAPCYIPKHIHELLFPEHPDWGFSTICETRMLVIPSGIFTEEELRGHFRFKSLDTPKDDGDPGHKKVGFDVD